MQDLEIGDLKQTIKQKLLVERLELEDITADDIEDGQPLFGEGLGLDSVEAFEVMVGMEEMFGVQMEDIPADEVKSHLYSVETIARFIASQLQKA